MSAHCTCVSDPQTFWFETACDDCRDAELRQWHEMAQQMRQAAAEIAESPIYNQMRIEYGDA